LGKKINTYCISTLANSI